VRAFSQRLPRKKAVLDDPERPFRLAVVYGLHAEMCNALFIRKPPGDVFSQKKPLTLLL